MTTTPPDARPDPRPDSPSDDPSGHPSGHPRDEGPRVGRDEMRDLGRLRRSTTDRRIAGVAAGIARHLDLDPLLVRVVLVVLIFFGGAGLILYGACWLLVPAQGTDRAVVRLDTRHRTVALVVAGIVAAVALIGDATGGPGSAWLIVVLGLVVLLVLAYRPPGEADESPAGAPGSAGADGRGRRVRRGPVLFWFTVAATVFCLGLLGLVDAAGVPVVAGAYWALALGVIGAALVLGSVYGRPGGLVALGLVAALGTVVATVDGSVSAGPVAVTPTRAAALADSYEIAVGEITLDLREVEDLDALDGRTLTLDARLGAIVVVVPPGLDVVGEARATGAGTLRAFGDEADLALVLDHDAGPGAPVLRIEAEVGLGEITIDDDEGILR